MSKREKYSTNEIGEFRRVREKVNQNLDQYLRLPYEGIGQWRLGLKKVRDRNEVFLVPFIFFDNDNHHQKVWIRYYLNFINHKNSNTFECEGHHYWNMGEYLLGRKMLLSEVFDENNGWLTENDELHIEFGINVESVQRDDGVWKFNFYDTVFDYEEKRNMIVFDCRDDSDQSLNCHKQLLVFHSAHIKNECASDTPQNSLLYILNGTDWDVLEKCFQIAHGVQLRVAYPEINMIISYALELKLANVIRYCERQLIEMEIHEDNISHFYNVFTYNLNIYLKHLLKKKKSLEMMKQILGELDIQKMPSEAMKLIIAKLVYDLF